MRIDQFSDEIIVMIARTLLGSDAADDIIHFTMINRRIRNICFPVLFDDIYWRHDGSNVAYDNLKNFLLSHPPPLTVLQQVQNFSIKLLPERTGTPVRPFRDLALPLLNILTLMRSLNKLTLMTSDWFNMCMSNAERHGLPLPWLPSVTTVVMDVVHVKLISVCPNLEHLHCAALGATITPNARTLDGMIRAIGEAAPNLKTLSMSVQQWTLDAFAGIPTTFHRLQNLAIWGEGLLVSEGFAESLEAIPNLQTFLLSNNSSYKKKNQRASATADMHKIFGHCQKLQSIQLCRFYTERGALQVQSLPAEEFHRNSPWGNFKIPMTEKGQLVLP